MTDPSTSLDRLHDLALPAEVPWWPLAPGWYVVASILLLLVIIVLIRLWKRWRANAYRRAALRELAAAPDTTAIAAILRRTALAIAPRSLVSEKSGNAWVDWLAAQCRDTMPGEVRAQLTLGIYARPGIDGDFAALRAYAGRWVKHHRVSPG